MGFTPASSTPSPNAFPGESESTVPIHFGIAGSSPGAGRLRQLRRANIEQDDAEDDLAPRHRVRRGAARGDVAVVGQHVDDGAHDGERHHPPDQEGRPVHPRPPREEHQDHGDDRHGADGHPDGERQDLADPLPHDGPFPTVVTRRARGAANPSQRLSPVCLSPARSPRAPWPRGRPPSRGTRPAAPFRWARRGRSSGWCRRSSCRTSSSPPRRRTSP